MESELLLYYKCTACSECFIAEEIFFAHTRAWHCKILVSEGQHINSVNDSPFGLGVDDADAVCKTEKTSLTGKSFCCDVSPILIEDAAQPAAHSEPAVADSEDIFSSKYSLQHSDTNYDFPNKNQDANESSDEQVEQKPVVDNEMECIVLDDADASLRIGQPFSEISSHESEAVNLAHGCSETRLPSSEAFHLARPVIKRGRRPQSDKNEILNIRDHYSEAHMSTFKTPQLTRMVVKRGRKPKLGGRDNRQTVFVCEWCRRAFSSLASLKMHQRTHTGERPFECKVCGKCFSQSGSLKIHMRIHTGERPYKCDVCHKSFTQIGGLSRHKPLHNS